MILCFIVETFACNVAVQAQSWTFENATPKLHSKFDFFTYNTFVYQKSNPIFQLI